MKPTELMQACGSKNGQWKPESPEHWRWIFANGEGPERALAWVKLNSIHRGSPYCVNAAGEALRVDHMAADCEWNVQTAKNFCAKLSAEGRIRLQRGERIWYRADVPAEPSVESAKYSVQSIFPDYLTDFIESLPPDKKATLDSYKTWRKRFFADGMAVLRRIDEQVQDSTLLSVGCNKKRLPKRSALDPKCVQLSLLEAPDFLPNSVQSIAGYKAQNDSAHSTKTAPILIAVEPFSRTKKESVSQSVAGLTDRNAAAPDFEGHAAAPDYGQRIASLKTLLIDEYGQRFPGETPSTRLCVQINTALEGAPLELLQVQIRQRMKSSTSMGFALKLAEDVAARWKEDKPRLEQAERERAAREASEREIEASRTRELLADARRILSDPKATERDKREAREYLELYADASHADANREQTKIQCEETLDDPRASAEEKDLAREVLKSMSAAGGAL